LLSILLPRQRGQSLSPESVKAKPGLDTNRLRKTKMILFLINFSTFCFNRCHRFSLMAAIRFIS